MTGHQQLGSISLRLMLSITRLVITYLVYYDSEGVSASL